MNKSTEEKIIGVLRDSFKMQNGMKRPDDFHSRLLEVVNGLSDKIKHLEYRLQELRIAIDLWNRRGGR
ncbi:MAG: hypothetical protein BWY41_00032 [Candidatus Atribacteria bacterium ADurb.Bin276]|uniref:Uncharacterized protein n=1 Tax=Candidatus Atribacter allofermentans TaxID=1852833 RepID=A0A1V5T4S4_9BACT|nr:MAG: hypothetical protein BWY41_00032 [Candidatus Atribacteria bacterium ADurb.Bin276]